MTFMDYLRSNKGQAINSLLVAASVYTTLQVANIRRDAFVELETGPLFTQQTTRIDDQNITSAYSQIDDKFKKVAVPATVVSLIGFAGILAGRRKSEYEPMP
jgi:hypothetical protein